MIPEILTHLHLEDPGRYRIEMNVRVYPAGGFYTIHCDSRDGPFRDRVLSFICFFILNPDVSPVETFFFTIPTKGEGIRFLPSRASSRFAAASSSS